MFRRPTINVLVLTAALAVSAGPIVGPAFVRAAGLTSPRLGGSAALEGSTIANVDMQRVYAESEARVQADKKLRDYNTKMMQRFEEVTRLSFATFEEINEFNIAINAPMPTDAQKKRIDEIKGNSAARAQELQTLASKPQANLTAQDRARMRDLNAMQQQKPSILAQVQRLYQDDLTQEELKLNRAGIAEVREAVQKLAKEQGYTQVFDVSALVFAPNDMTDPALRKVKAKGK